MEEVPAMAKEFMEYSKPRRKAPGLFKTKDPAEFNKLLLSFGQPDTHDSPLESNMRPNNIDIRFGTIFG